MSMDMRPLVELIPDSVTRGLANPKTNREALSIVQDRVTYLPVAIIPGQPPRLLWIDVGDRPFTEWKFRYSIQRAAEVEPAGGEFSTSLDILLDPTEPARGMSPSGFVFQMSLCGSTLVGRALARSARCVVLNEPTPLHEPLWEHLSADWMNEISPSSANLRLLRNLIVWTGRARSAKQRRLFVKFRSWNAIFVDILRKAFPEVPCLFMYRAPEEVLVSALKKEPTGYTRFRNSKAGEYILGMGRSELDGLTDAEYYSVFYRRIFETVGSFEREQFSLLDYRNLTRGRFEEILRAAFRVEFEKEEFAMIEEQFDYYSKDDANSKGFRGDSRSKQDLVTPAIREVVDGPLQALYERLRSSRQNLV